MSTKLVPCPATGGASKGPCGSKRRLEKNVATCSGCSAQRRQAKFAAKKKEERDFALSQLDNIGGNWENHFAPDNIKKISYPEDVDPEEMSEHYPEINVGDGVPTSQLENTKLEVKSAYGGTINIDTDNIEVDDITADLHDGYVDIGGYVMAEGLNVTSSGDATVEIYDVDFPERTLFVGNRRAATPSVVGNLRGVGDTDDVSKSPVEVNGGSLKNSTIAYDTSLRSNQSNMNNVRMGVTSANPKLNGFGSSVDISADNSVIVTCDFLGESNRNLTMKDAVVENSEFVSTGSYSNGDINFCNLSNFKLESGGNSDWNIEGVWAHNQELMIPAKSRLKIPKREDGKMRHLDFNNAKFVPVSRDKLGSTVTSPAMIVEDTRPGGGGELTMFSDDYGPLPVKHANDRYEIDFDRYGAADSNNVEYTSDKKARMNEAALGEVNAMMDANGGSLPNWNEAVRGGNMFFGNMRSNALKNMEAVFGE